MKILLTGATGYIGKRLLPALVQAGYSVICGVRDPSRLSIPKSIQAKVSKIKIDLLDSEGLNAIPKDIDGAYYLVHSMSSQKKFTKFERNCAINFRDYMNQTQVQHVVYLSGIVNDDALSDHLSSRKMVEEILDSGSYNFTTLRAGIIIGSGSASFEIIRDLVEKLPVMVAPKWLNTKCQPIGIRDVITLLTSTLFLEKTYNKHYDIGGPNVLTYKEMLLGFAKVRDLKRWIFTVPVMTPRLSSYWLYFVTSTTYNLAVALVDSMKVDVVCKDRSLLEILDYNCLTYEEALEAAFDKIENNAIVSSWKDSFISGRLNIDVSDFIQVPRFGCFKDKKKLKIDDRENVVERIWRIGGGQGWYYGHFLWRIRGYLDKMMGGIGLRRGRTNQTELNVGDALDFWRVVYADKKEGRLLLFAEMKLPGEAWLEFRVNEHYLLQTATFRPKGVLGRIYWYLVLPFHFYIFNGMIQKIGKGE